jgi:outer membrane protein
MMTLSSRASWPRVSAAAAALAVMLGQPLFAQQPRVSIRGQAGQVTPIPQRPVVQLTMDQAVAMAIEHNLTLKGARISLPIADQGIAGARAAFLPNLTAGFNRQSSLSPPSFSFQGTDDINALTLTSSTTVGQQLPWFGGDYRATWGTRRGTSTDPTSTFNPSLGSSLTVNFNQPLWRDLKIDGARAGLETSELQRSIADLNLEAQVINLEVQVRNAYLSLVASIEGLKVANQNVDTAETALKAARSRVDVGIAPQIDIVAQEVNVSRNKASQLRAQINIQSAEDALRELILDPLRPDYWTASLEPTETVDVKEREVNVDEAIANALKNRIDLRVARRNLEITDFNLRVAKNATLPDLSLGFSYTASGSAGRRLQFDEKPRFHDQHQLPLCAGGCVPRQLPDVERGRDVRLPARPQLADRRLHDSTAAAAAGRAEVEGG